MDFYLNIREASNFYSELLKPERPLFRSRISYLATFDSEAHFQFEFPQELFRKA